MADQKPDESREDRPALAQELEGETELRFVVAPLTQIDVREPSGTDDNTYTMSGYAAVFNQQTVLYDGKFFRVTEEIDPQAFDRLLREQPLGDAEGVVHFNFGHDMNRAVAATDVPSGQPGSLQLKADKTGLHFLAKVPRDDPDGVAMAVKMRSGVLRQASFAFTIGKLETTSTENEDGPTEEHDRILEVRHLYDVCATPQGAYSGTVSQLRSYAAALGQPAEAGGQPRQPDSGGESAVSPTEGGGADETPELEAVRAKAERDVARWRELRTGRFKSRETE